MKICGIIAEYNPFHNGHKYMIEETRRRFGATHIVAVMSGNFTQRGDVAIYDKYKRAEMALNNGIDLVIELPVAYALGSAEQFAFGAVSLLGSLGCVEMLSFGSECGNIDLLNETAGAVMYAIESEEFLMYMRHGDTYPIALQKAIEKYYTDEVIETLATPNNTLAVEYIKAINEYAPMIEPHTIKRAGAAHDGSTANGEFASASLLRSMIRKNEDISGYTPIQIDSDYADVRRIEVAILSKLRTQSPKDIEKAPNVLMGLENRIHKAAKISTNLAELYTLIKTKRYTMSRIRRIVLANYVGIEKKDLKNPPSYVRILGMNSKGGEILSAADCKLPVDTSLAKLKKISPECKRMAYLEENAGNLYALAFEKRRPCGLDYTQKPIILK